jgi:LEA14-like dessication related protein
MLMWTHAVPGNEVRQRTGASAVARWVFGALVAVGLTGCAGMPAGDPLQVTVAGVEPMQGEGMELRMMVKLRVQNPNDAQVDYDGAYVRLTVQDKTFATGVSDARGTVPRFGEAVVAVPVTVSMLNVMRHVIGAMDDKTAPPDKVRYSLEGKLHGTGFSSLRFKSQGEFALPGAPQAPDSTPP